MFWAWNWKSPPKNLHKGIYKTLINFWWIRRNWDKASLLQIFHILEFIWWPSHRNYLFVDRKWKWLRLILSDLFPNQIWIFFFLLLAPTAKIMTKGYTWSDFKHHNTVDFFVFLQHIHNHIKSRYLEKQWQAIILQSCILDMY